jgi:hypothetical protein
VRFVAIAFEEDAERRFEVVRPVAKVSVDLAAAV